MGQLKELFFDKNKISIDGSTSISFSDDYKKRFESYGWSFIDINGHNEKQIDTAIKKAHKSKKPTLPANVLQPYPFLVLEAIWSKVDASSGWQSELGRALAKKVKSTKEFAIACDPDFKVRLSRVV